MEKDFLVIIYSILRPESLLTFTEEQSAAQNFLTSSASRPFLQVLMLINVVSFALPAEIFWGACFTKKKLRKTLKRKQTVACAES